LQEFSLKSPRKNRQNKIKIKKFSNCVFPSKEIGMPISLLSNSVCKTEQNMADISLISHRYLKRWRVIVDKIEMTITPLG
jgi:hypothetical protein